MHPAKEMNAIDPSNNLGGREAPKNGVFTDCRWRGIVCLFLLLWHGAPVYAVEFSGRLSLLELLAHSEPGDYFYDGGGRNLHTIHQQALRLMLDSQTNQHEWSVHWRLSQQYRHGISFDGPHSSELFRSYPIADTYLREFDSPNAGVSRYEFDRLNYEYRFESASLKIGRQAIDWGSGQFWQPLNIFGAFSPTDLDTDYKAGIDAINFQWYADYFSTLTAVYAFAPRRRGSNEDSFALNYRHPIGDFISATYLAGRVVGSNVLGFSIEGDVEGIAWRGELLVRRPRSDHRIVSYWIAGVSYQLGVDTAISAEWHDNGQGAGNQRRLRFLSTNIDSEHLLLQQLSRRVLGFALSHQLSPLWQLQYTALFAFLRNQADKFMTSSLHQLSTQYSVAENMDLLVSVILTSGASLRNSDTSLPRTEFGASPSTLTVRYRYYF